MKSEADIRQSLRQWVTTKSKIEALEAVQDHTLILEKRIITSVQLMDLIMYLEFLMDKPVDVTQLKPGVFNSIDSIYQNFFNNASRDVTAVELAGS